MSAKTSTAAPKANVDSAKWTPEENANLLLLIMQEDNKQLGVKGWKTIGERAQNVFGDKYGLAAVKHQFQRLRKQYINEFPIPEEDAQAGGESAKTPTKGRKRTAASMDSPDAEEDAGTKTKKARVAKKPAKRSKAAAGDAMQDDDNDAGDSDGAKQKPMKTPKRRAVMKAIPPYEEHDGVIEEDRDAEASTKLNSNDLASKNAAEDSHTDI
ncbi:uncharacterized protein F4812DRAFT_467956 [Daldinia caldariorum]|uniref:uncharacterized protein n=1 Tax=Daldinia caldariorum TaxID=326644 RepID=UPI002007CA25|nr:uncharacterized protein F4812DRAFT_467956 [Daldinia caldariorum]KAI1464308.1 hypothetical protein F4812DRAFT_467956 [Daldinia caldariorum]